MLVRMRVKTFMELHKQSEYGSICGIFQGNNFISCRALEVILQLRGSMQKWYPSYIGASFCF